MSRTLILGGALATLLLAAVPASSAQTAPRRSTAVHESILEVLEQSLKSGKGVLVYLGGQAIGGAVLKVGEQTVELRNREYGRIVLRLDRIDGVAGN